MSTFRIKDLRFRSIKLLFVILVALTSVQLNAQEKRPKRQTAIFLEVLGQSLTVLSLNLETDIQRKWRFLDSSRLRTVVSIGYGDYRLANTQNPGFNIPIGVNIITNKHSNHHFEGGLGLGVNKSYGAVRKNNGFYRVLVSGRLGYRYQKPEGGLLFRAAFTPPLFVHYFYDNRPKGGWNLQDLDLFFHIIGVSVGYSF